MKVNKSIRLRTQGHIKGSTMRTQQDKTAIDGHITKDVFQSLTGQANFMGNKQTLPTSTLASYQGLSYTTTATQDRVRCMKTAEDVSERVSGQADQYKNEQSLASSSDP